VEQCVRQTDDPIIVELEARDASLADDDGHVLNSPRLHDFTLELFFLGRRQQT
jgi:hypothetical protein